jgi:hypothetical protein
VLVCGETHRPFAAGHLDRHDLVLELAGRLRAGEPLLRAQRPFVLGRARDLKLLREILGVPARMLIGKGVV